ncbi:MAG: hypothetical protein AABY15_03170 [Nanoarchaeota archaeon]
MKNIMRIIGATLFGAMLMALIAWTKGNENIYTYELRKEVNPKEIKNAQPEYDYYIVTTITEVVKPSSIPMMFESTYDTIGVKLVDKWR